ncbi:ankyrin repeat domain-containing protein [Bdellovibrio sp. 22V]|uniref:ankyrin repeat domain-containing protein n=1 Tax=Bdellovibrio TaxID=958 RepID=UPI0025439747|nr:ankyrin repeat domain-containing protein [Bdellovibrio sp. 22V]WII73476.1 ankyrin repeat domain-containing protein [Bdellovibrio sp. 22V]
MRTWADYKQTAVREEEIFDFARNGDIKSTLRYLATNGDPNVVNHKGHSPLMLAAYNGHSILVDLLLEYGADANSRDNSGSTILMGVSFKGHVEIARRLIANGAEIHAINNNGQTALMYAEAFGREEIVRLFTEMSPDKSSRGPKAFRRLRAFSKMISNYFTSHSNQGAATYE